MLLSMSLLEILFRNYYMSKINQNYLYTETNEWVAEKGDVVRIGIDDYSQNEFGEIVFVDLPKVGQTFSKDDEICVIESVKTASDIYTPLTGEVIAINSELVAKPKLINESCYDNGWLFEIKLADKNELKSLIKADDYKQIIS